MNVKKDTLSLLILAAMVLLPHVDVKMSHIKVRGAEFRVERTGRYASSFFKRKKTNVDTIGTTEKWIRHWGPQHEKNVKNTQKQKTWLEERIEKAEVGSVKDGKIKIKFENDEIAMKKQEAKKFLKIFKKFLPEEVVKALKKFTANKMDTRTYLIFKAR